MDFLIPVPKLSIAAHIFSSALRPARSLDNMLQAVINRSLGSIAAARTISFGQRAIAPTAVAPHLTCGLHSYHVQRGKSSTGECNFWLGAAGEGVRTSSQYEQLRLFFWLKACFALKERRRTEVTEQWSTSLITVLLQGTRFIGDPLYGQGLKQCYALWHTSVR